MATAKKADLKIKSTNFAGDDGKLIYLRAHYDNLDGKPTSYPPTSHNHTISEVTGLSTALGLYAEKEHAHDIDDVAGLETALDDLETALGGKAPTSHNHEINDVTGLQTALDDKAPLSHGHTIANVSGLSTALDGKAPSTHSHTISNVTGLQTALNGKAASSHSHAINDVTGLQSALGLYSPLTHTHDVATTSASGFMSTTDKTKLNGIATGAQKNSAITKAEIETSLGFTPENPANKRTTVRTDGSASSTAYVSESGVKDYVESMIGSVYRPAGNWNANTNFPHLAMSMPENLGKVYRVSVAGTRFGYNWSVGDKLTFIEGGAIAKWDNVDDVTSVNGETGAVVLTASDVGAAPTSHKHTTADITDLTTALSLYSEKEHTHDVATTSAAGFMSSSDKTKLNGITPNATANTGTVTSVTAEATTDGMSMLVSNGTSTPKITASISNPASFRAAIGAGTGSSNLTIGTTASTAKAGNYQPTWGQVTGKPTWIGSNKPTYTAGDVGAAPLSHSHTIANVTGLQAELNGKAATTHTHEIDDVTGLETALDGKAPSTHTHTIAQVSGLQTSLNGKAPASHSHSAADVGARSNTWTPTWIQVTDKPEVTVLGTETGTSTELKAISESILKSAIEAVSPPGSRPASDVSSWAKASSRPTYTAGDVGAAPLSHSHTIANVTGLQAELNGKAATTHTHEIDDVTGLETALDGKAASSHTHAINDVTGLQTALSLYAPTTHTHSLATTSAAGFMSAADKTKLNGLTNNTNTGTVTKVSAGTTQIPGMTMLISNGTSTPTITTSISNAANFRSAIGASGLTIGTTATTAKAGNYQPTWVQVANKPAFATSGSYNDLNDKLVAGNNITIDANNVISASGGGGGGSDYELTKSKIDTALVGGGVGSIQLGNNANAALHSSTAVGLNASASAGSSAAFGSVAKATGSYSTAVGGQSNASGESSVSIGRNTYAMGKNSTALGYNSYVSGENSTVLGYNAVASSSNNTIQLGHSGLATLNSKVSLTVTSDIRDKADIEEVPKALDFIKDLNPITYVGNDRDNYISEEQKETDTYKDYLMVKDYDRKSHSKGTKKGGRRRVGLSAQEVRDKLIEHYGSDNYANVVNDNFVEFEERGLDIPKGLENKLTMSYETMVPFLIKAIQEQQEQIEELKKKINKE